MAKKWITVRLTTPVKDHDSDLVDVSQFVYNNGGDFVSPIQSSLLNIFSNRLLQAADTDLSSRQFR